MLGEFKDHQGFDGVILDQTGQRYHLEFTYTPGQRVGATPVKISRWSSIFLNTSNGSGAADR